MFTKANTKNTLFFSVPAASGNCWELQTILSELPEEFRTPLILYYFEEFSYKQIARQMDVPIGTVMSRLARAKKHLRHRLTTVQPVAPE